MIIALATAFIPLYAFYINPYVDVTPWLGDANEGDWMATQWQTIIQPLDQWLADNDCYIDAWCIRQLPRQPALLMALISILCFAFAFSVVQKGQIVEWHKLLLLPQSLKALSIQRSWRTVLSAGLFIFFALLIVLYQAAPFLQTFELWPPGWDLGRGNPNDPASILVFVWVLGIIAVLAAALIWDSENESELKRTYASGTVALGIVAVILSVSMILAGFTVGIVWLMASSLLFIAGCIWSWREKTRLQPVDYGLMLGGALVTLLVGMSRAWLWNYAFIGDEWAFFEIAHTLLREPEVFDILTTHDYANSYHTVLSSYIQAWIMQITTVNMYGWRLSALLPMVFSIPAMYVIGHWFGGRLGGFLSAGLLASSHMLYSFSMVPYNNTQAVLTLTLSLGLFAFAIHSNSLLRFLLLGFSLGTGFLVYALGRLTLLPLLILLVVYAWPQGYPWQWIRNRQSLYWTLLRASAVIAGVLLMGAPMIFNLDNWLSLLKATPVQSEIADQIDMTTQMGLNALQGVHSFLTNITNTHYVYGPHLDPLTTLLVFAGIGVTLATTVTWSRTASIFVMGMVLIITTSAIQQYEAIATTRMFPIPVIYTLVASIGGTALLQLFWGTRSSPRIRAIQFGGAVVLVAAIFGLNQYHIEEISLVRSHINEESLFVQQLQQSATSKGGGMTTFIVDEAGAERLVLILRAYDIADERLVFLDQAEALSSSMLCGIDDTPAMLLIRASSPVVTDLDQRIQSCWPGHTLAPIKNHIQQARLYRFLNAAGEAEWTKPIDERITTNVPRVSIATQRPAEQGPVISGDKQIRLIGEEELRRPMGVAVGSTESVYVVDSDLRQLLIFDQAGDLLKRVEQGPNNGEREFNAPIDVVITEDGHVYILDAGYANLLIFDSEGNFLREFVPDLENVFLDARGISVDSEGNIWVASTRMGVLVQLDPKGKTKIQLSASLQHSQPVDVIVDSNRATYAVEAANPGIVHLSVDGIRQNTWDLSPFNTGAAPHIALGRVGNIIVTQPEPALVTEYATDGTILNEWQLRKDGSRSKPVGIDVDSDGRIWVADADKGAVVVLESWSEE
ncbi:MAG: glycosyltransferase family 39 protein [Chloroflexota bacterium]